MPLIRLQDNVPEVYPEDSRDFQLFCHLYDVVVNGLKYDIDGVKRLVNSHDCKSTTLQLLQTKLGFFTEKQFTDVSLRSVLEAFPLLVRKKGTVTAIKEAVYLFLKTINIETSILITVINDEPSSKEKILYGSYITDHSILIGIESSIRDTSLLYEVLKYIIPFGYNLFFYFYVKSEGDEEYHYGERFKYAIVGNDLNAMIKGSRLPGIQDPNTFEITYKKPHGIEYNANKYQISYPEQKWSDIWDEDAMEFKDEFAQRNVGAINTIEIIPQGDMHDEHKRRVPPKETGTDSILDYGTVINQIDEDE